jgi:hypothetical protein
MNPSLQVVDVVMNGTNSAEITIKTSYPAPYTFLETNLNGKFSDNGFWFLPGTRNVTFTGWSSFSPAQLMATLTMTSVYSVL